MGRKKKTGGPGTESPSSASLVPPSRVQELPRESSSKRKRGEDEEASSPTEKIGNPPKVLKVDASQGLSLRQLKKAASQRMGVEAKEENPVIKKPSIHEKLRFVKGKGLELRMIGGVEKNLSKGEYYSALMELNGLLIRQKREEDIGRKELAQFTGCVWLPGQKEKQRALLKEKLRNFSRSLLLDICTMLEVDIETRSMKEVLITKLAEFLEYPDYDVERRRVYMKTIEDENMNIEEFFSEQHVENYLRDVNCDIIKTIVYHQDFNAAPTPLKFPDKCGWLELATNDIVDHFEAERKNAALVILGNNSESRATREETSEFLLRLMKDQGLSAPFIKHSRSCLALEWAQHYNLGKPRFDWRLLEEASVDCLHFIAFMYRCSAKDHFFILDFPRNDGLVEALRKQLNDSLRKDEEVAEFITCRLQDLCCSDKEQEDSYFVCDEFVKHGIPFHSISNYIRIASFYCSLLKGTLLEVLEKAAIVTEKMVLEPTMIKIRAFRLREVFKCVLNCEVEVVAYTVETKKKKKKKKKSSKNADKLGEKLVLGQIKFDIGMESLELVDRCEEYKNCRGNDWIHIIVGKGGRKAYEEKILRFEDAIIVGEK